MCEALLSLLVFSCWVTEVLLLSWHMSLLHPQDSPTRGLWVLQQGPAQASMLGRFCMHFMRIGTGMLQQLLTAVHPQCCTGLFDRDASVLVPDLSGWAAVVGVEVDNCVRCCDVQRQKP
jgi:hypothetical protein